MENKPPQLLSPSELADQLRKKYGSASERQLLDYAVTGQIPAVQIGNTFAFNFLAVESALERIAKGRPRLSHAAGVARILGVRTEAIEGWADAKLIPFVDGGSGRRMFDPQAVREALTDVAQGGRS